MMQVYQDDRLVGTMNIDPGRIRSRLHEILLAPSIEASFVEEGEALPTLEIKRLCLEVKRRAVRLDSFRRMEMEGVGMLQAWFKANAVPENAEVQDDFARDAQVYSWRAFAVTKEQHEELFDLDSFQPV